MLSVPPAVKIFFCLVPADMRRGFDGLMRMAEEHLRQNVLHGGLFVFINRRRDRVKLLYWDLDGLCIFYKRLEQGTFEVPTAGKTAGRSRCRPRSWPCCWVALNWPVRGREDVIAGPPEDFHFFSRLWESAPTRRILFLQNEHGSRSIAR